MVEESKDEVMQSFHEPMEDTSQPMCRYCLAPMTQQEQEAGKVNMFLGTECYHQFHIPCFQQYAKKTLVTIKKGKKDVEFSEPECAECKKVIPVDEAKELIGGSLMREIEEQQMVVRIQSDPNMVKCECGAVICLESSAPDYKQKDDTGKLLSKAAAEHMA